MGYIDFDGIRYWDVREIDKWYFQVQDWETGYVLPSDATRRADVTALTISTIEQA